MAAPDLQLDDETLDLLSATYAASTKSMAALLDLLSGRLEPSSPMDDAARPAEVIDRGVERWSERDLARALLSEVQHLRAEVARLRAQAGGERP